MHGTSSFSDRTRDRLERTAVAVARADERIGDRGRELEGLVAAGEGGWSTWVDGVWVRPQNVMVAEVFSRSAAGINAEVLTSIRVMQATRDAVESLGDPSRRIGVSDLVSLHDRIEPGAPGLRHEPSWLVRSGQVGDGVAVAPAPADRLPGLMDEVARYMSGTNGSGLVRCAISYAQLDSLHPFESGNGRTARVVLHALLRRTGVLRWTLLPVSTGFARPLADFERGMHRFRRGPEGVEDWLESFCAALEHSARLALELDAAVEELRGTLIERLLASRAEDGRSPVAPRADSVLLEMLRRLPADPVVTVESVREHHGISTTAAQRALAELERARILTRARIPGGRQVCWIAEEYLVLVTLRGVYH